jgi:hypothetical protein
MTQTMVMNEARAFLIEQHPVHNLKSFNCCLRCGLASVRPEMFQKIDKIICFFSRFALIENFF